MIPDETGLLLCLDCLPTGLVLRGGLGVLISSNSFTFTPGGIGKFFVRLFGLETVVLSGLFVVTVCCEKYNLLKAALVQTKTLVQIAKNAAQKSV